tara:strand:+ start:33794 stop:34870 length:1077 start_codon:yes stop_codon:yes gene_type:complete
MEMLANLNSTSAQKKITLKVIGVGGAGCYSSERLSALFLNSVDVLNLDRNIKPLERLGDGQLLYLPIGDGGWAETDHLQSQYSEMADRVGSFMHGADVILILAGLGRGMGSVVAPLVAETARESGALTISSINMPFEFEGKIRIDAAKKALKRLRIISDSVLVMKNDELCNPYGDKLPVREALQNAGRNMANIVQDILNLLSASESCIERVKCNLVGSDQSTVVSATATGLHAGRSAALNALSDLSVMPNAIKNVHLHIQGGIGLSAGQAAEAFGAVRKIVGPYAEINTSTQREMLYGLDVRVTAMLIGNDLEPVGEPTKISRFRDLSSEKSLLIFENPTPVRKRAPVLLPTGLTRSA